MPSTKAALQERIPVYVDVADPMSSLDIARSRRDLVRRRSTTSQPPTTWPCQESNPYRPGPSLVLRLIK